VNSPGVMDLLDKADRSLAAAEHLLADGLYLLDAFDLRNLGDYGAVLAVDDADAQQAELKRSAADCFIHLVPGLGKIYVISG